MHRGRRHFRVERCKAHDHREVERADTEAGGRMRRGGCSRAAPPSSAQPAPPHRGDLAAALEGDAHVPKPRRLRHEPLLGVRMHQRAEPGRHLGDDPLLGGAGRARTRGGCRHNLGGGGDWVARHATHVDQTAPFLAVGGEDQLAPAVVIRCAPVRCAFHLGGGIARVREVPLHDGRRGTAVPLAARVPELQAVVLPVAVGIADAERDVPRLAVGEEVPAEARQGSAALPVLVPERGHPADVDAVGDEAQECRVCGGPRQCREDNGRHPDGRGRERRSHGQGTPIGGLRLGSGDFAELA
mmetsp:Transcript_85633/g.242850  ORF Transcript_85633/g.242850 Transcript_85633/m.242850 type:complete len:299 (-) Transcript_85633:7-903(-)